MIEVASRGGNFLLNVGPQPDGLIQPEFQDRRRDIGDWLRLHGESIYGTTYSPVEGVSSVRTTAKDNQIFVHVFDWPASTLNVPSLDVPGITAKIQSAHLLATGQPLKFRRNESKLQIDLPSRAPDPNASVIALNTL